MRQEARQIIRVVLNKRRGMGTRSDMYGAQSHFVWDRQIAGVVFEHCAAMRIQTLGFENAGIGGMIGLGMVVCMFDPVDIIP